jgi:DNA/RNA-binding domain of Phe-tRNA-synthetase-like protein
MIEISDKWKKLYPGAAVGVLVMRAAHNPAQSWELDKLGDTLVAGLRERFAAGGKPVLRSHPVIAAYESYYKTFRKTYHVTLQLESVIWKGRGIPSVSAMVKAMFMAELSNMLLTAGHDLAKVGLPLRLDVGSETETYVPLGGDQRAVKEGDMRISDAAGVISSVIGGPDQRTSISADTKDLLFTVYAPPGIGEALVRSHLEDVERFVRAFAPEAVTERLEGFRAE